MSSYTDEKRSELESKRSDGDLAVSFDVDNLVHVPYDKGVDITVDLAAGHVDDAPLEPKEASRLRWKLDRNILPLLFAVYTLQNIDKGTLGASAILGIKEDNGLDTNEWNNLGSAFYIGFLLFEYPQNWALQRFPVAKWISINLFLWSLFLGLHAACHSYGGLFILRFLLGASEGCVMAGLVIITSMFYTRTEIGERIGWTFQCNGVGQIISGFIQFGVANLSAQAKVHRWQWLIVITSVLTFVVACIFLWRFPDNPTTARFLSHEEKIRVVRRIRANQNGIETKVWKRHQVIEALTDTKTWLFFLFAVVSNLQNGLAIQYAIIIKSFGFTTIQTTLLNIPSGAAQIIGVTTGGLLLRKYPNSRTWIAVGSWVPSILAGLLLEFLPWSNKAGLLTAIYLISLGGAPAFVMVFSWVASTVSGHTKKTTVSAIFLIGYALGQILCTQFWKAKYQPRNRVPWGICLASWVADIIIILAIHVVLKRENRRRDAAKAERQASGIDTELDDEFGYVDRVGADGRTERVRIEKNLLDLTDKENRAFRYVL